MEGFDSLRNRTIQRASPLLLARSWNFTDTSTSQPLSGAVKSAQIIASLTRACALHRRRLASRQRKTNREQKPTEQPRRNAPITDGATCLWEPARTSARYVDKPVAPFSREL